MAGYIMPSSRMLVSNGVSTVSFPYTATRMIDKRSVVITEC